MSDFTTSRYSMAFRTPSERSSFFAKAHLGVEAGTAMKHVLGTNLGVWGDESRLRDDVINILRFEIDTWARANERAELNVPALVINADRLFQHAFRACRAPNSNEIDEFVRTRGTVNRSDDADYRQYLDAQFVEDLYFSLRTGARAYRHITERYETALRRQGF